MTAADSPLPRHLQNDDRCHAQGVDVDCSSWRLQLIHA
ncbi:hypothetical protein EV13_2539 [Prochlorococcus sp. MIT 0702]|nr:hypothetical protein EV12_2328 [Prochlorococcus sp. MIT 0701]KGG26405.1 hypothetical protein EV13_2539 [Prochlorococcus sp. MIT 0702]KGG31174.1 hypothetical protein EV14_2545 [Prochlorococcus sp. MIT 0703]